jgi:hypothetical protein
MLMVSESTDYFSTCFKILNRNISINIMQDFSFVRIGSPPLLSRLAACVNASGIKVLPGRQQAGEGAGAGLEALGWD